MNLPAHGTTSPDPSIASLLKRNTTQVNDCRISARCSTKCRQAEQVQTAWWDSPLRQVPNLHVEPLFASLSPGGYPLVARCRSHTDPLLWCLSPGGPRFVARRIRDNVPLMVLLSPGAQTRAARRHISSRFLRVISTLISLIRCVTQIQTPK